MSLRPLIVFFAAFTLYLSTLSYNYPYDGVVWSMLLEWLAQTGDFRFESPHYLAYFFLSELSYFLFLKIAEIRAIVFLQVFSAFFGALAVAVFDLSLKKQGTPILARVAAGILLATSPTVWRFATTPEVYSLTLTFLVLSILLLEKRTSFARRIALILMPVIGHQSLATFGAAQIAKSRGEDSDGPIRVIAAASVGVVIFTALSALAFAASPSMTEKLPGWFLGYAAAPEGELLAEWWSAPLSTARALALRPGSELSTFPYLIGWPLFLIGAAGLFLRSLGDAYRRSILGIYLLLQLAFVSLWDAEANDFWVLLVPPIAVGLALFAAKNRKRSLIILVTVIVNAALTFHSSVAPFLDEGGNPELGRAEEIERATGPESLIVIAGCGVTNNDKTYIPYFADRVPLYIHRVFEKHPDPARRLAALDEVLAIEAARRPVFLTNECFSDIEAMKTFRARFGIEPDSYIATIERWKGPPHGLHLRKIAIPAPPNVLTSE